MSFEKFCEIFGIKNIDAIGDAARSKLIAAYEVFRSYKVSSNEKFPHLRAAAFMPKTVNETERTLDFAVATDSPVFEWHPDYGYIRAVLSMEAPEVPDQVPMLDTHMDFTTSNQLGAFRNPRFERKPGEISSLIMTATFGDSQKAFDAWRNYSQGLATDCSARYSILAQPEYIPDGKTAVINGRVEAGPLLIIHKWRLSEASLCPIGADQNSKARSLNNVNNSAQGAAISQPSAVNESQEARSMKMTFKQFCRAIGKDASALTDHERAALEILFEAYCKDLDEGAEVPAEVKERASKLFSGFDAAKAAGVLEDIQRQKSVEEVCQLAGYPEEMTRKLVTDRGIDQARAIETVKNWKKDQSTAVPQARASEIQAGANRPLEHLRAAGAQGLAINFGAKIEKPGEGVEAYRNGGKERIMRELLRAHNVDSSMMSYREVVDAMFSRSYVLADFANITADAMNISFKDAVAAAETTYQDVAEIGNVDNFKNNYRARLMDSASLEEVTETGEYKILKLSDEGSYIRVVEHGKSIPLSRKLLLDGSLDIRVQAINRVITRTQLDIEAAVYGLLINNKMFDGSQIFTSGHKNIGTAAALSETSLDDARILLAAMAGDNGQPMGLKPKFVVTGAKYARVAAELCLSMAKIGATNAGVINYYKGLMPVETSAITDGKWFLLGNPAIEPHLEAAFLNGQRVPQAKTSERVGASGIVVDVNLDYGVACHSWRNAIKNAGA